MTERDLTAEEAAEVERFMVFLINLERGFHDAEFYRPDVGLLVRENGDLRARESRLLAQVEHAVDAGLANAVRAERAEAALARLRGAAKNEPPTHGWAVGEPLTAEQFAWVRWARALAEEGTDG